MNERLTKEIIVPEQYRGQRIDVVLAQLFSEFSRSQLSHWLKEGAITINQRLFKPKDKVYGGEQILLQVLLQTEETSCHAEQIPLDIVYEDDCLIIINKPAGLVVHPGAGNPNHTLVNALLNHHADLHHLPRAGIVHRLDKDTTGLLIVAKTLSSHTALIRQMQAREIQRRYLALVYGHVIAGGKLETFYGRHPRNRLKMTVCQQGKEAITEFSVHKQYQYFTLLEVKLLTGRTHQIRVHMEYINHPIVGDLLYGGRTRFPGGASLELRQILQAFKRQALHAYFLSLRHPDSQKELTFSIPLPDDFQKLLTQLDAYV
ncbi:23S rRNA pseudouridine(1911/1915/1917) synthase RluD [Legionella oakridgensis]|uniref:23S rRNA pseudouridine(1911/1915/1917) synthase RluD n=1 Tax=Legionella oakridgensis TaxID=29423 RepID=UPI0003DE5553|nr:23S rRNA pseudouridine(1911/1915/1917) synthase RluD [Legionella oakridgensis]ETO92924.1 ribosomal large, subunit pseudouridine synthase D [Legionella oakridgensis RV-2-2007]